MALLEPGWEAGLREPAADVAQYACLGKVVAHHRLADGRYNLLLMGVGRVRILEELSPPRSFRQAKVELLHECCGGPAGELEELRGDLLTAFKHLLPCSCQVPEQLTDMLSKHLPLGHAHRFGGLHVAAGIGGEARAAGRVSRGGPSRILLKQLEVLLANHTSAAAIETFPPPFSDN